MKKRRSLLAVVLTICMVLTCSAFPTYAASGNYLKVQVTQNYADAQQVLKLINKERSKRGLKKLKLDQKLTKSATKRAAELIVYIPEGSPHRRPNGKLAKSINKKISYECCAEGYTSPKSVMSGWMHSKPHKRGILLKNARSVGIGCVISDSGDKYWTLEFSSSKAKKKETRTSKVTSTYKIFAKAKYLKKSKFEFYLIGNAYTDDGEMPLLYVGEPLNARVFFTNNFHFTTALRGADFIWKSSNPAVATVDAYGRVTPKAAGTFTITAKMKDRLGYTFTHKAKVEDSYSDDDWDDWDDWDV